MIRLFGLISPILVPLIVSGLLFLSSEKNNRPKLFLAGYMLLITFVFGANYYYFEHNFDVYIWLHSLHIATVLAIYPGAYVYVKLLTDPGIASKKLIRHFIPSIFFFFASALIFFPLLSTEEKITFLAEYRYHPDFSRTWMKILYYIRMANIAALFVQVFLYLILTFRVLYKHRKAMAEIFSNPERFQLNWLRIFNYALALSAFIAVFIYSVNPVKLFGDERFLAYPLLLIALILWFLGIMGNNQKRLPDAVFSSPMPIPIDPVSSSSVLAEKLLQFFAEKKPYLDPDLKIWDITTELGTNRTYISNTINQEFNQNFSGFVNSYRVNEVKKLLKKDPGIPLKILVAETGFGSVSSLNRSFTENAGQSISEFRNSLC